MNSPMLTVLQCMMVETVWARWSEFTSLQDDVLGPDRYSLYLAMPILSESKHNE